MRRGNDRNDNATGKRESRIPNTSRKVKSGAQLRETKKEGKCYTQERKEKM